MTIKQLVKEAHNTAKEKGFWDGDNHNIPEKLMLVVTELSEGCEYIRKHGYKPAKKWKKDDLGDELADAVIRIADLCGYLGIDLEWQLKNKMEYNKKRSYKHGKRF